MTDEQYKDGSTKMKFSEMEIRIAESIRQMGLSKARDRLNFLKNAEGGLTDWQYMRLWHLVHVGEVSEPEPEPEPAIKKSVIDSIKSLFKF